MWKNQQKGKKGNVPDVLFSLFKKFIINKPMYQVINNLPIDYDFQSKTKENPTPSAMSIQTLISLILLDNCLMH